MTTMEMEMELNRLLQERETMSERLQSLEEAVKNIPVMPDYKADIHDAIEGLRGDIIDTVNNMSFEKPEEPPAKPDAPHIKTPAELMGLE